MQEQTPPMPTVPPTVTIIGGIYNYQWEQESVQIILERLREDSRRTVTAEIKISARPEGHIHQTRINLLATRSRNEVARYCRERCQRSRDWEAIIEQLCVMTLDVFREGEPVVNLGEVDPPAEPIYRLRPFIVEGEATIIYGEGGIGKSFLAGFMAATVDQNLSSEICDPLPGKVLYLDYETTRDIAARRFQSLTRGFGFGGSSQNITSSLLSSTPLALPVAAIQRARLRLSITSRHCEACASRQSQSHIAQRAGASAPSEVSIGSTILGWHMNSRSRKR